MTLTSDEWYQLGMEYSLITKKINKMEKIMMNKYGLSSK